MECLHARVSCARRKLYGTILWNNACLEKQIPQIIYNPYLARAEACYSLRLHPQPCGAEEECPGTTAGSTSVLRYSRYLWSILKLHFQKQFFPFVRAVSTERITSQ